MEPTIQGTILTLNITPTMVNYVLRTPEGKKVRVKKSTYSSDYQSILEQAVKLISKNKDDYVPLNTGGSIQIFHKDHVLSSEGMMKKINALTSKGD